MPGLVLLPLDERPVNTQLPADVAAIAGETLSTPPRTALPEGRSPGDRDALVNWLAEALQDGADQAVVSIDLLVHGGLISSRTSTEDFARSIERLGVVRELKQRHPGAELHGIGLVQRAPDSYVATEEPDYWREFGRQLHCLGGRLHRRLGSDQVPDLAELTDVPQAVVSDFERRRLRNHMVNLYCLTMTEEEIWSSLALTADDTAGWSAGSAEQQWLRHWMRALPRARGTAMYPGADEVAATLLARLLAGREKPAPAIQVRCAEPPALERTPPYENQPLRDSIVHQMAAVGARASDSDADAVLILHGPDAAGQDMNDGPPTRGDPDAVERTGRLIQETLHTGLPVAVADVRYPNGADPALGAWLIEHQLLLSLDAYSAWNTAGNTLGSALALQVAGIVGRRSGRLDPAAQQQALVRRLLDDYLYQSVIRSEQRLHHGTDATSVEDPAQLRRMLASVEHQMRSALQDWGVTEVALSHVAFPWHRSFEVAIELTHRS